ncbi:cytochrome c [Blattabacterium sp. (Cryptocercus kyebangensis)]|uniref:c-type cytochrome n=1 Tax=Blattabacterium sp. (Cryptocercus kyebangensis) TaxID=298656 RepID=UPI000D7CF873|nr:cytochrome c [Blattabacterium sp. (Cryptocercus kyebangensis)]AWU43944.1 cytochrome c [Blattabacterium sp. (Cryptocercus kyebangensis)]
MNNKYFYVILLFLFIFINGSLNSCWFDKSKPNRVYMPDMYYSDAYEPYSEPYPNYKKTVRKIKISLFLKEKTSSLLPVKGTIPRNSYEILSYIRKKNKEYNTFSKKEKNEDKYKKNIEDGEKLYKINCSICHGDNGDGQGILVKNEKIFGIPNYKDRDLTIGSIYHVITYGKNNMSSYASQLNESDRWKLSEYVMYLKKINR